MTTLQLLTRLRKAGVRLHVQDGSVRVLAPPHVLTDDLRQSIAERRAELVEFVATALPRGPSEDGGGFSPPPREGSIPLTWSQERLWLLDQLDPNDSVYHVPVVLRFRGGLSPVALARSLTEIVRRHESLRTTFPPGDAGPVQLVGEPYPVVLPVTDLSSERPEDLEVAFGGIVAEAVARPFDLSRGPLFRASLLRLGESRHVLVMVMHHIVFDGWSASIFLGELAALYSALQTGAPPPLPEPVIQFQDYARWERRRLGRPERSRQLDFWRERLKGMPPALEGLADRARPAVQSSRGSQRTFVVPPDVARAAAALTRAQEVTLFVTLCAALQVLIYRWTGERDFAIGTPTANRRWAETEGLIGFFLNTLVIRGKLSAGMTFIEVMDQVRAAVLGAYANQDVPFEEIVQAVRPARSLSHSPVFQVMLVLQNTPPVEGAFADPGGSGAPGAPGTSLLVESVPVAADRTKYDLDIHLAETETGLRGVLSYSTDLFDEATIDRLTRCFVTLLASAAARPETTLLDLPLWAEEDAREIAARRALRPTLPLAAFPRSELALSLPARFEKQVDADPRALAVRGSAFTWTYAELDNRANLVAREILRGQPAGTGRVGLLFSHDAPMVAAMLGTLKAGRAFVPLDPEGPALRSAALCAHAGCQVLLAEERHAALAERISGGACAVVTVGERGAAPTARPGRPVPPEAQAYVLYTSGSTGEPKGVVQSHRNVMHFISAYTNNLHVGPADRLSLLSPYCFDAAVMDIFGALLNGASLHIYDIRENGFSGCAAWLNDRRVSIYHSTPTVFRELARAPGAPARFPSVRLVVLGGEPARAADFETYKRLFGADTLFVNGFGPTESTVTLQFLADHRTRVAGSDVPVGWPVEDTAVQLLDETGAAALVGEIAIRSRYVALGYHGLPDLTEKVFRREAADAESRTYLTGDIGRRLPSGEIVFVGRKDAQVKIRGHRVEPSESELLLRRHPEVREAAVVARRGPSGENTLAAYVVPAAGGELAGRRPGREALRSYMREHLPDYMIPATFTLLPSLPLLPNGKIDRVALPAPDLLGSESRPGFVAPRTPTEQVIAECWAQVLGLERVGVNDDFFELGGDSLTATRLVSRIRETLRADIPLRALFQETTVAGLAGSLSCDPVGRAWRYSDARPTGTSLVPMQPRGGRLPLFLVAGAHAEEEEFLRYLSHMIPHLGLDQPVFGFRPRGLDGELPPHPSAEEMARDYLVELRRFRPRGPYLLGGECIGGVVAYEMARTLRLQGEEVRLLLLLDTPVPTPAAALRFAAAYLLRRTRTVMGHLLGALTRPPREGLSYLARVTARRTRRLMPRTPREGREKRIETVERGYSRILYRYRPHRYPGRVTVVVNEKDFAARGDLGWGRLADVETRVVPGDHLTRLTVHGRRVAQELRACMDRVQDLTNGDDQGRGSARDPAHDRISDRKEPHVA